MQEGVELRECVPEGLMDYSLAGADPGFRRGGGVRTFRRGGGS